MNAIEYEEIVENEVTLPANDYDEFTLNTIREKIEIMSKFNQIEILRILTKYKEITINENKYGIHINLNDLPNNVLEEMQTFIHYVNMQETDLNSREKTKEQYKNTFFGKRNKEYV
jgi:hypothetical protein